MAERTLPSPGACELIFHAALRAGDAEGVRAALIVMAAQDPHRAEECYHLLQMALIIDGAGRGSGDTGSTPSPDSEAPSC